MYIKPLSAIIDSHSIIHHSFADDLQLHMSAPPDRISELLHSMQSCTSDVKAWATANMLKLNDNKTELMLVTSKRTKHLHSLSNLAPSKVIQYNHTLKITSLTSCQSKKHLQNSLFVLPLPQQFCTIICQCHAA